MWKYRFKFCKSSQDCIFAANPVVKLYSFVKLSPKHLKGNLAQVLSINTQRWFFSCNIYWMIKSTSIFGYWLNLPCQKLFASWNVPATVLTAPINLMDWIRHPLHYQLHHDGTNSAILSALVENVPKRACHIFYDDKIVMTQMIMMMLILMMMMGMRWGGEEKL